MPRRHPTPEIHHNEQTNPPSKTEQPAYGRYLIKHLLFPITHHGLPNPLNYGDDITASILVLGEEDSYTFSGQMAIKSPSR